MPTPNPLSKIEELKAQIAKLQGDAVQELRIKRERIAQELAEVDAQIREITGEPASARRRSTGEPRKVVTYEELTELLKKLPGQTLNIRKEGYDVPAIKTLAAAHSGALQFVKNGPWPTVTLL